MAPLNEALEAIADLSTHKGFDVRAVYEQLSETGKYTDALIIEEMRFFFNTLGLDAFYFETTPPSIVAQHIESLFAGKLLSKVGQPQVNQSWETVHNGQILLACYDRHDVTHLIERRIDEHYRRHRVRTYRSDGTADPHSNTFFRLYFVTPTRAGEERIDDDTVTDIERLGDENLLLTMSASTKQRYQTMVTKAREALGPVITFVDREKRDSMNLLIACRRGSTHSFFSAIFDLLHAYDIVSERAYVEQFRNGVVLYSIHLPRTTPKAVLDNLKEDLSLVFALPRTSLTPLFRAGKLTAQEVIYAYTALRFACQFLTRYREAYAALAPAFQDDPIKLELLHRLKERLAKDTFTQERVTETIVAYPEAVRTLYRDFREDHMGSAPEPGGTARKDAIAAMLRKNVQSPIDLAVLESFLTFNRHIVKTNFYLPSKVALSFRLDPSFLVDTDHPDKPYAVYLVVGSEFRGFHVRFRDIARGGVRIITSVNHQAFVQNSDFLFHECYHLAHTQQKKNKDIAEGGAKGAILLSFEFRNRATIAFKKYVDALLDLMMPSAGSEETPKPADVIFLGPDEGTADLMDWASHHARQRGYPFWKSFTTGKSVENGGIPHDRYGMTTHSIHQYVLAILEKLGLSEQEIRKLQTGGPDGDLGSNEIKVSKDKTTSIVDGSGVLHDPEGIHRGQLHLLAEKRLPVAHFDKRFLSERGFLVTVDDRDVRLPDGSVVENGLWFRNEFHLSKTASAELFVPCGGRPDAVNITNVHRLMDGDGRSRFRIIVEGANLFFSPEARLLLEKAGAVLIKDATANKGGVTSSSYEVLAGLCLTDQEFDRLMAVRGDRVPAFYEQYVREVKAIIAENARLEFECIWRERQRTRMPGAQLSDQISDKINALTDDILGSEVVRDEWIRRKVLTKAVPEVLRRQIGLDAVADRAPRAYLAAVVAAYLASQYVYRYGLSVSETRFVAFLGGFVDTP